MLNKIVIALVAVVCTTAVPTYAQTTALFFDSQPGDYIGQGQRTTWTPSELTFSAGGSSPSYVRIQADNFGVPGAVTLSWRIDLRAPEGAVLAPGMYERAARAPFRPALLAGIDVGGNGRGCNTISGRFVIHEIAFSGATLTALAADFEQHCEGARPALFGAIRFNSSRATLVPFDGAYPTYSVTMPAPVNGFISGPGIDCGAGRSDCSENYGALSVVGLSATPSPGYVFLGWGGDCFGSPAVLTVDRPRYCVPVFNSATGAGPESPDYRNAAIHINELGSPSAGRRNVVQMTPFDEITVTRHLDGVRVAVDSSVSSDGDVILMGPAGTALVPGDYPYAAGTSIRTGLPGLDTSYCGSGGRFRIYELTYSGNSVASFAADIEQRCGELARVFTMSIRYRSSRSSLLPFNGESPLYKLGVQASTGGRVSATGIDCGAGNTDCEEVFNSARNVNLQALPSPGYEFLGWSGACTSDSDVANVLVDRARLCQAYFQPRAGSGVAPDSSYGSGFVYRYQPGATPAVQRVWSLRDSSITASSFSFSQTVSISANGPHGQTDISFGAPSGGVLAPGYYEEAYPSGNATFPRVSGGSSTCSVTRGRFRIYEFTTSLDGQLLSFAADFELQCAANGPVFGAVRFNATRAAVRPFDGAFPAYTMSITPSPRGIVTGQGFDCGAGRVACSQAFASPSALTLTATPVGRSLFLGWRGDCNGMATTTVAVTTVMRCAAVFIAPNGTAATEDPALSQGALLIESDPGDTAGRGIRQVWSADAVVSSSPSFSRNRVSLSVQQRDGRRWSLDFRAPSASDLATGAYENAISAFAFSSPFPGMQVTAPSASCSSPTGRFYVHEIAFGASNSITRLAVDFEQRCGQSAAGLRGAIRFNSSRPNLTPFAPAPTFSQRGIVLGLSAYTHGGWIASRSGSGANYSHNGWARLPWDSYNASGKGVRVAAGNLDDDELDELVVGVERGGNGWMAVLDDGAHGFALLRWIQVPFQEYNAVNGEVWPAVGDLDGDGRAEIVAGLGNGGGGWFAIFGGAQSGYNLLAWRQVNWAIYNAGDGSTRPAIANVDGVGGDEIIVGLGPGSNGWIEIFSDSAGGYAHRQWLQIPWATYNAANGETFVAAGDLDGDGSAEIVAGLGVGGAGYLYTFDDAIAGYAGLAWRRLAWSQYADDPTRGQIYPAVGDIDGDGRAEIVLGLAPHPQGGWFQILDDSGTANASLGWRNVDWVEFVAAGGGVFPAIGRFW